MIKKLINKKNIKIVFFGDSITEGFFEFSKDGKSVIDKDSVYHNKLKSIINYFYPEKEILTLNKGIGGQNSTAAIDRLKSDVIDNNPDLVVVCFGLNDIYSDIEEFNTSLDTIFKAINKSHIPCIYMTPNMLNTKVNGVICQDVAEFTSSFQNSGKMDLYMESAIQVASNNNITICDCYNVWKRLTKSGIDTNKLIANGINHPNREMHWLFAQKLFETIFLD